MAKRVPAVLVLPLPLGGAPGTGTAVVRGSGVEGARMDEDDREPSPNHSSRPGAFFAPTRAQLGGIEN
jgi:hypothetical protein